MSCDKSSRELKVKDAPAQNTEVTSTAPKLSRLRSHDATDDPVRGVSDNTYVASPNPPSQSHNVTGDMYRQSVQAVLAFGLYIRDSYDLIK